MSYNPYFQSNDTPFIGVPGKETTPPYVRFPGQLRCLNEPRVPVLIPTSANRGLIQKMPANNILPETISQMINPDQTSLLPNAEQFELLRQTSKHPCLPPYFQNAFTPLTSSGFKPHQGQYPIKACQFCQ